MTDAQVLGATSLISGIFLALIPIVVWVGEFFEKNFSVPLEVFLLYTGAIVLLSIGIGLLLL